MNRLAESREPRCRKNETRPRTILSPYFEAFLDEALGDEDAARAVYDEACAAAAGNPLVWEGAVNFERHRKGRPVAERLRRVREIVGRCCRDDAGVTREGRGDVSSGGGGGCVHSEQSLGGGRSGRRGGESLG